MRIAMIVEGQTERVFLPYLRAFLQQRLPGRMPRLDQDRGRMMADLEFHIEGEQAEATEAGWSKCTHGFCDHRSLGISETKCLKDR